MKVGDLAKIQYSEALLDAFSRLSIQKQKRQGGIVLVLEILGREQGWVPSTVRVMLCGENKPFTISGNYLLEV